MGKHRRVLSNRSHFLLTSSRSFSIRPCLNKALLQLQDREEERERIHSQLINCRLMCRVTLPSKLNQVSCRHLKETRMMVLEHRLTLPSMLLVLALMCFQLNKIFLQLAISSEEEAVKTTSITRLTLEILILVFFNKTITRMICYYKIN